MGASGRKVRSRQDPIVGDRPDAGATRWKPTEDLDRLRQLRRVHGHSSGISGRDEQGGRVQAAMQCR